MKISAIIPCYNEELTIKQVIEDITQFFGDMVFKTVIPRNVRLAEAPSHGLPINYYDKSSKGSKAFAELAKEVIDRA